MSASEFAVEAQLAVTPFAPIDLFNLFNQDAFNRVHRYNLMLETALPSNLTAKSNTSTVSPGEIS
ncbi:hypothetical protein M8494_15400 [Serratia ureilytica]